jgi:hypothetical protein
MLPRFITRNCSGWRIQFLLRPLNELWRSNPSEVISRYSTPAIKTGSTRVAFGLRTALVSLDLRHYGFGLRPSARSRDILGIPGWGLFRPAMQSQRYLGP